MNHGMKNMDGMQNMAGMQNMSGNLMQSYNMSSTNWNNANGVLQRTQTVVTDSVPWLSMGIGIALGMIGTHYIVKSF